MVAVAPALGETSTLASGASLLRAYFLSSWIWARTPITGSRNADPDAASSNARLAAVYGALSVAPLVDQLGKKCVGVLVVHVAPEPDRALRALGALTTPEGRRRLNNACVEMNGLLAR